LRSPWLLAWLLPCPGLAPALAWLLAWPGSCPGLPP